MFLKKLGCQERPPTRFIAILASQSKLEVLAQPACEFWHGFGWQVHRLGWAWGDSNLPAPSRPLSGTSCVVESPKAPAVCTLSSDSPFVVAEASCFFVPGSRSRLESAFASQRMKSGDSLIGPPFFAKNLTNAGQAFVLTPVLRLLAHLHLLVPRLRLVTQCIAGSPAEWRC